jgi:cyclopropane-fatty-acyl-phospholipid synthase
MDTRAVVEAVFSGADRPFGVRLWDGTRLPPLHPPEMPTLVLAHDRAAAAVSIPPSEERLADAYLAGDLEVDGDLVEFLSRAAAWRGPEALPATAMAAGLVAGVGARAGELLRSAARHTLPRDESAIRHHYDVGNDFYRLFLDEQMVYSCAYWAPGVDRLEVAQTAKLELICRKLALRPDQRLLDVGCGWGGLVAHAARMHGARCTGITLSQQQFDLALERMKAVLPPGAMPDVRLVDYRQLPPDEPWDAIASVGMMEHVGRENLERYFTELARHLAPGGLLLNQAITEATDARHTIPWLHRSHGGFIRQEIFPDSDPPPLDLVVSAAQRSGFEVLDLETMRPFYGRTLTEWLGRLERRFPEAAQLVGKRRARAWRLYLASCIVGFRTGRASVAQLLLRRTGAPDVAAPDHERWYRDLAPRG